MPQNVLHTLSLYFKCALACTVPLRMYSTYFVQMEALVLLMINSQPTNNSIGIKASFVFARMEGEAS